MVIAPFFVMPTVSALVWKNLLMNPVSGFFAWIAKAFGLAPIDWFAQVPMLSVILIVAWEWTPFATLIIFTALQSLDLEQKEAAEMDGAGPFSFFSWIVLPHLARPITVVIMIETIFFCRYSPRSGHHGRWARPGNDEPRVPCLPAGDPELQRRGSVGGRHRRRRARQHRGLLSRPRRRQEPGGLSHGPKRFTSKQDLLVGHWLDRGLHRLLSDLVDGDHQLQDRA
jgi:hypothetical protein